jgi:hypothetical protein
MPDEPSLPQSLFKEFRHRVSRRLSALGVFLTLGTVALAGLIVFALCACRGLLK